MAEKSRKLIAYDTSKGTYIQITPQISLQEDWLIEIGFSIGAKMNAY